MISATNKNKRVGVVVGVATAVEVVVDNKEGYNNRVANMADSNMEDMAGNNALAELDDCIVYQIGGLHVNSRGLATGLCSMDHNYEMEN